MLKFHALVFALTLPMPAIAQTVLNPTMLEFKVSPDHAAVKPLDDTPLISSYMLRVSVFNGAVVHEVDLGKPIPNAAGMVSLPLPSTLATVLQKNVKHTAVVLAVGPDGNAASEASNPFGYAAPAIPAAPGRPTFLVR